MGKPQTAPSIFEFSPLQSGGQHGRGFLTIPGAPVSFQTLHCLPVSPSTSRAAGLCRRCGPSCVLCLQVSWCRQPKPSGQSQLHEPLQLDTSQCAWCCLPCPFHISVLLALIHLDRCTQFPRWRPGEPPPECFLTSSLFSLCLALLQQGSIQRHACPSYSDRHSPEVILGISMGSYVAVMRGARAHLPVLFCMTVTRLEAGCGAILLVARHFPRSGATSCSVG